MFRNSETKAFISGVCQCHQDSQNKIIFTKYVVKEITKINKGPLRGAMARMLMLLPRP